MYGHAPLSAMGSSTLSSSAMDSSAIGVGVAVLVGKFQPGWVSLSEVQRKQLWFRFL